jgi:hypothetical protein
MKEFNIAKKHPKAKIRKANGASRKKKAPAMKPKGLWGTTGGLTSIGAVPIQLNISKF